MVDLVAVGNTSEPECEALVAEFDDVDSVIAAARATRGAGYTRFEVYSPFPIHGIERAMGLRATRLPWIVLACGLTGTSLALLFQWWSNGVDYPFRISGKPLFGLPAAVPVTFEFTVLLSAFAAFLGMLVLNRLPEHHRSIFDVARFRRATDDGFFLAIDRADAAFDPLRTRDFLARLSRHPIEVCRATADRGALPGWVKASLGAVAAAALVPFALIAWARASDSTRPPIHIVADMDSQPRYRAQVANTVFADGRAMRPDAAGTVAFEGLVTDAARETGKRGDAFVDAFPIEVTPALVARGRERFTIYCTPCHGQAGYGDGLVAQRAAELQEPTWVPPASLHDATVRGRSPGQLFDTVRNGARTMPGYRAQVGVDDAWAIVAYVRALQRSRNGRLDDVPAEERKKLEGP